MATKEKIRSRVLNKVEKLSDDKLSYLESYINDLDSRPVTNKSTLTFSGIFCDLELNELTTELHKSREDNNERIPQF